MEKSWLPCVPYENGAYHISMGNRGDEATHMKRGFV
jgi:hypothetical protein